MDLVSESVATRLGIDPRRGVAPAPDRAMPSAQAPRAAPEWARAAAPPSGERALRPRLEEGPAVLVEVPCPVCAGPLLVSPDDREGVCPHCERELEFEVQTGPASSGTEAVPPAGAVLDPMLPITSQNAPLVELRTAPEDRSVVVPDEEAPRSPIAAAPVQEDEPAFDGREMAPKPSNAGRRDGGTSRGASRKTKGPAPKKTTKKAVAKKTGTKDTKKPVRKQHA